MSSGDATHPSVLVLMAHGSRDREWREPFENLAQSLQAELGKDRVRLAYMDCTPPSLMDVARDAVTMGAREIKVLPLFLAGGGQVDRNISLRVNDLRRAFSDIAVKLLPVVGQHPSLVELIRKIAIDAAF